VHTPCSDGRGGVLDEARGRELPPDAPAVNPERPFGVGGAALRVTAVPLRRLGLGMSGRGPDHVLGQA